MDQRATVEIGEVLSGKKVRL